jgi:hypothetical protein
MPAWSGLFNGVHGEDHSLLVNETNLKTKVTNAFRRLGLRKEKALLASLIGAAAGGTATLTRGRIEAITSDEGLGGVRTVETVTDINRATTAADVTALKEVLAGRSVQPDSYDVELSGNNSTTAFKGR